LTSELVLGGGLLLDAHFSRISKVQKILPVWTLFKVLTTDAPAQPRTRDLGLQQTSNHQNDKKCNNRHISEMAQVITSAALPNMSHQTCRILGKYFEPSFI